ncbi:desulfoferrodoxin family protein [Clostridium sp. Marseille-P299]|uniref:desulfoferrodoxin family protein n=1 Tax=Clostridium sp. Marseille-P299 TaxID=1805477 RepID=UPI000837A548|nr:desulfoferrodoxin family protein [Clostridium sp. Marseille-P299]
MEPKFFICKHCGNIVEVIHSSGAPLTCCGDNMTALVANTSDGATEKHVPVFEIDGNVVKVTVGSVEHPMLAEHHIAWIYLKTDKGTQRKKLTVGEKPYAEFALTDDETVLEVYEYCNLHGLWVAKA